MSGIVTPNVYSGERLEPKAVYGLSIANDGLSVYGAVNGYGLLTKGFLWELYQIWFDTEFYEPIVTSWADSDSVITTTWTPVPNESTGSYYA